MRCPARTVEVDRRATAIVAGFSRHLPDVRSLIDTDIAAAYRGDPAARSLDEVLICYPGLIAIIHHRMAHVLHGLGARLVARIMSEIAHGHTGIDIHPGARIGEGFSSTTAPALSSAKRRSSGAMCACIRA
jgi:serine O-acetyltransferase